MDIVDTRDTLLLWVRSCQTAEQVYLMEEVIEELIVKKFERKFLGKEEKGEHPLVIESAKSTLLEQMDIQLTIINQKTVANQ